MTPFERLDERTPRAKQLVAMMKATMNLDLDELIAADVIEDRSGQECSPWTKWNKDAPMFIVKLSDRKLNSLAALIKYKFPDAFNSDAEAEAAKWRKVAEGLAGALHFATMYVPQNSRDAPHCIAALAAFNEAKG